MLVYWKCLHLFGQKSGILGKGINLLIGDGLVFGNSRTGSNLYQQCNALIILHFLSFSWHFYHTVSVVIALTVSSSLTSIKFHHFCIFPHIENGDVNKLLI